MPNKLVLTQNCRNPKHKHTQIFNWAVGSCIIVGDCVRCQVLSKKKKAFDNRWLYLWFCWILKKKKHLSWDWQCYRSAMLNQCSAVLFKKRIYFAPLSQFSGSTFDKCFLFLFFLFERSPVLKALSTSLSFWHSLVNTFRLSCQWTVGDTFRWSERTPQAAAAWCSNLHIKSFHQTGGLPILMHANRI